MKRYLNISLAYAIAAMAGGVFYREFTKYNSFTGVTSLGKVHTHLFLLGMLMFLIVALFAARKNRTYSCGNRDHPAAVGPKKIGGKRRVQPLNKPSMFLFKMKFSAALPPTQAILRRSKANV